MTNLADLRAKAEAATLLRNARIVAEYWRDEMMQADGPLRACSHPLAMVLAALDGETEPIQMGITPDEHAARAALLEQKP